MPQLCRQCNADADLQYRSISILHSAICTLQSQASPPLRILGGLVAGCSFSEPIGIPAIYRSVELELTRYVALAGATGSGLECVPILDRDPLA